MKGFFSFQCSKVGESYGRKMMQRVMKAKELNVSEAKSGKILGKMNSQAQRKRRNVAGHSLNPNVYNAKYFGHKNDYNQNDKLGMFEVAHVCARDGFSGIRVIFIK